MENLILIIVFGVGLFAAFIDSSFRIGYGILTPFLLLLDYSPLVILPIVLFSQLFTGLTKAIYHSIYQKIDYTEEAKQDSKTTIQFTVAGMGGMIFAIILVILFQEVFMNFYIGVMIIVVGIFMISQKRFKFSERRMCAISFLGAFNQTISGAGYGPLAAYQQMFKKGNYQKTEAITSFSEAMLSGFGFLLYYIWFGFPTEFLNLGIIIVISGIIATPLGSLTERYIKRREAKYIIGIISLGLGILLLVKLILFSL
jgi:uncharacterized membrane protein YfcA